MKKISLLGMASLLACASAFAADAPPADGQWRGAAGAGFSMATGNARNTALNLTADAARVTAVDKWTVYGQALYAESKKNNETTTNANLWRLGTRYDHNITEQIFGFGGLDLEHDQLKHLNLRGLLSAGVGYHVIKTADTTWDVFGGLAYEANRYMSPGVVINDETRRSYTSPSLLLGEESTHRLTETTSFRQRLVVYPYLRDSGEYRAVFDAGLAVAMTKTMNLTLSFQDRYDSMASSPVKQNDTLFIAGVNMKFGAQ